MNKSHTITYLFVALCFVSVSAAAAVSPCTDCDGLGVCQTNGKCRCFAAYIFPVVNGTAQTNSCAETILAVNPGGVKAIRAVSAGISFILFALIMWRLYLEWISDSEKRMNNIGLRRVVLFSLAMDGLICFLMFLLSALDWWGNFNILPSSVYNALYNLIDWLYIVLFVGILLHWAELYQKTMKSIRTRDMMKKVNSNYNGEITVEQVMSNLTFLQRFKIPFIAIAGVTFLIWIARIIGSQLINDQKSWNVFFPFMILFYAVVWIGFGIGFCFYGYKLMRVMPEAMGRKIRWITIKLNAVLFLQIANCVQIILFLSVSFLIGTNTTSDERHQFVPGLSNSIFGRNSITFVIRLIVSFIILEIYMPISKFRLWFSTGLLTSTSNSGGSSSNGGASGEAAGAVNIEIGECPPGTA
ncbi:hypothetical protein PROFUN_08977 [Planoprotostelium fungivorum]|uniref:THH1/TOM1/TOM3 domain-containing protein n=1 Tax=Planoprotostelium fungivorum TaxID=1890364 RepID=A0A2P6NIM1_9EUKA|nr:hypothetical protein PROFUN_08977 [Planoprotostelium fungivorum]